MAKFRWSKVFENVMYIVAVGVLFMLAASMILTNQALYKLFNRPVIVKLDEFKTESRYGELEQFFILADRFADNHKYNITDYNCVNYSLELKEIADKLGFDTKVIVGCKENNSTCHAFMRLEMDFEPQNAEIADYSKKYPIQSEWVI